MFHHHTHALLLSLLHHSQCGRPECNDTGAAREGILTYTTLDASQHTRHAGAVPLSGPYDKKPTHFAPPKPDLAGTTAVHARHAEPAMHAEPASAAQPADLSIPDKVHQALDACAMFQAVAYITISS